MNITLNIWVVLFTCGFAMGIFMTILFIVFHKRYSRHTHNITITLCIMSLLLFSEIAQESNLVDDYPLLIGTGIIMDLLLWPFLLFYVQFITGNSHNSEWKKLLYFIPYILAFIWQLPILLLPNAEQLAIYSNGISLETVRLVAFKMLISTAFLFYMVWLLSSRLKELKRIFLQNRKVQFLLKARQFFMGITGTIVFIYLLFFNFYFDLLPLGDSDRISSLIISGFFYFFGAMVFRNPQIFQEENYSKQVRDFFKGTERQYKLDLLTLFENKKIYLDEKLAVKDVAKEIGLTDQQLSYLINRQMGITFLDLINTYRVKEVQDRIQKGDHLRMTLLGLALESGFNSKASFNRIFKDHTRISPSDYVKKIEKEVSNRN